MDISGFGQRIIAEGLLSEDNIKLAIAGSLKENKSLITYLAEQDKVDTSSLAKIASEEFGFPYLDLEAYQVREFPNNLNIKPTAMEKNKMFPLFLRGEHLFIAVYDPTNVKILDDLKFQTNLIIEPIITEYYKLLDCIKMAVSKTEINFLATLDEEGVEQVANAIVPDSSKEDSNNLSENDAPIVKFINKVILEAISTGVSDIHLEPYEHMYRVRFRQDGVLREYGQPPISLASRLSSRIKIMSKLDISEKRIPQDGRFKMRISSEKAIDFRVSTCPTLFGEKIVMRILDPTSASIGIDALGYEDFQKEAFLQAINLSQGMVLVTGPTGSGKTVSLYTALNILNTEDINISTAEDPVEINLPGINQVNVNVKAGLTFATALRAFLRQDPDVIMLGEIRDLETAEIAIKAAQTGHMVLSTLHTNSAPETLNRLMNMGVPAFNVATSISLIVAQRLARKLCSFCKAEITLSAKALIECGFTETEINEELHIFKAVGCKKCKEGYKGRIGIYEVMPISKIMGEIIMNGGSSLDIANQATKENIWFLHKSGLNKVKKGLTSLEELSRVI